MENVAIIGCGAIASTHIHAILYNNKKIVGICDVLEDKAITLKNDFQLDAKVYTNYIDMLNDLTVVVAKKDINVGNFLRLLKTNKNKIEENNAIVTLDKDFFENLSKNCYVTFNKETNSTYLSFKNQNNDYHYSLMFEKLSKKAVLLKDFQTNDPEYDGSFVKPIYETDLSAFEFKTKLKKNILR